LEGKFAEFDDYVVKLSEKREELYNTFIGKKQAILDKLNKRITGLFQSSERIIAGIANRLIAFDSVEEINGYLATDIMAEKVRDIISKLRNLGDSVKADEISAKLKTLKEDSIRQLKDKKELYVGGENVIKLGKHQFSVNTKAIELSIVQKEKELYYHITGTDFWDKVVHEEISKYHPVFDQSILSENVEVYRAEYLAYSLFEAARNKQFESLDSLYSKTEAGLAQVVQKYMEPRYQEGYTKGVHDIDGAKLLKALLDLHYNIDLLIYKSQVRALARLFWNRLADADTKELLITRLKELAKVQLYFNTTPNLVNYVPYITGKLENAYKNITFFDNKHIPTAAEYLCKEIMKDEAFVVSKEAEKIYNGFISYLRDKKAFDEFSLSLKNSMNDIEGAFYLIKEWVNAYRRDVLDNNDLLEAFDEEELSGVLDEVIVILIENNTGLGRIVKVETKTIINGLVGSHGVIKEGTYTIVYTKFMHKLKHLVMLS
jgi:hypothetical protein